MLPTFNLDLVPSSSSPKGHLQRWLSSALVSRRLLLAHELREANRRRSLRPGDAEAIYLTLVFHSSYFTLQDKLLRP